MDGFGFGEVLANFPAGWSKWEDAVLGTVESGSLFQVGRTVAASHRAQA